MAHQQSFFRNYLSLALLFIPGILFGLFLLYLSSQSAFNLVIPFGLPFQFYIIAVFGVVGTIGGALDWRYHRDPLKLKISKQERDAEAKALGLGGAPMFILMVLATLSNAPRYYLLPILVVLIYTVVAICYDEFVFHIKRCGKEETIYHRMLVFGNAIAWLSWIHFIYV